MKRSLIIDIICYAFFFLFMYTAISKLTLYSVYLDDLDRSPLLGPYAGFLSIFIPGLEIVVSGLLLFDRTRLAGLLGSTVLMLLFTVYVIYVLSMVEHRPCSCGGIIKLLSWKQHLIFNIVFLLLAITGYWLHKKQGGTLKYQNSQ